MLMCLLICAFAGTYGEEKHESESVPTATETAILIEKPEVYTRTIVRPVSYSFISANVQPVGHKYTEETTEDFDNGENQELQKLRTVLPGNHNDLQHNDYSSNNTQKNNQLMRDEQMETTTTKPRRKFRRLLEKFPIKVKEVYENGETPRSRIYLGRGRPTQRLPPIPEITLQPPPLNQNIQSNQSTQLTSPPVQDIEEKSSSNVERRNPEPSDPEPIIQKPKIRDNSENEEFSSASPEKEDQADLQSEHKEEPKKEIKKESGKGSEFEEHNASKKGHKGDKGYKKDNKHEKSEKGHHDKESHQGKYHDEHGAEKKYHKGEGFYGEHHKEEKGKKGKKYVEGKSHKKGHSTHGQHNIVKKNEYIKTTKFYDEDHDDGETENHSEYHGQHAEKEGGKKEGSHKKKGYHKKGSAKKGHHGKGHHGAEDSGFENDKGSENYYGHEETFSDKKGEKKFKKWEKE